MFVVIDLLEDVAVEGDVYRNLAFDCLYSGERAGVLKGDCAVGEEGVAVHDDTFHLHIDRCVKGECLAAAVVGVADGELLFLALFSCHYHCVLCVVPVGEEAADGAEGAVAVAGHFLVVAVQHLHLHEAHQFVELHHDVAGQFDYKSKFNLSLAAVEGVGEDVAVL